MTIASLRITDFRNLVDTDIAPCAQGLNIITGNNASGKTSVLEAIHYLSHGKSFRSSTISTLIQHAKEKFSIYSQLVIATQSIRVGAERDIAGASHFRVSDKDISSVAELASILPVRIINSHSHQIFESGPIYRRKYLDWGLFYQSESFFDSWRHFERILKQRNALLRDRRSKNELDVWTNELIKHGLELDKERRRYIALLSPYLNEVIAELLPECSLELSYLPGWDDTLDYSTVLSSSFLDELRAGHTLYGPHRADLDINVNGVLAKQMLSRGQQKLLVCAMILAQGKMLAKYVNKRLIYLIDDLPSELDSDSRKKLVSLLINQQAQIFITAIEAESVCNLIDGNLGIPLKVFHVEHGKVSEAEIR